MSDNRHSTNGQRCMGDKTTIEWTRGPDGTPGATWNPVVGCSVISPGCTNCYAMREAGGRLRSTGKFKNLTQSSKAGPVWTGEVRLWESALEQPLRWTKPRMIFVNSMSDLFHESVPDEWIDRIFAVMGACDDQDLGHTFQILTKRAGRQRDYMRSERATKAWNRRRMAPNAWPPRNIWAGVSVEDQPRWDERWRHLAETPAAVRWISYEPALGPVKFDDMPGDVKDWLGRLHWVVVGGESGPGARPMELAWAYSIVEQCRAAHVPCFVKQMGSNAISTGAAGADPDGIYHYRYRDRKGGDWSEWHPSLRVRQYPAQDRA